MIARAASLLPLVMALAPAPQQPAPAEEPTIETAQIVKRYPHDPRAFTEGLFIDRGELFESTGELGRSSVRQVDLATGRVLRSVAIPAPQFGEGIVPWQGQILSLTWQNRAGYRWNRKTFRKIGTFTYEGEGWALTSNGREVIMSDGTDELRFVDPARFRVKRTLKVTVNGRPLRQINELEWIRGEVWANIWMTDYIARIDPVSGKVKGIVDLTQLHHDAGTFGRDQVANGIAYDAANNRIYLTGKEWPWLYEVRLVPVDPAG